MSRVVVLSSSGQVHQHAGTKDPMREVAFVFWCWCFVLLRILSKQCVGSVGDLTIAVDDRSAHIDIVIRVEAIVVFWWR